MPRLVLILLFLIAGLITISYHPKPVCTVTQESVSCTDSGWFGWLMKRQRFVAVDSPPELPYEYHYVREYSFVERFLTLDAAWDMLVIVMVLGVTLIFYTIGSSLLQSFTGNTRMYAAEMLIFGGAFVLAYVYYRLWYELYYLVGISWFFYPFI